MKIQITNRSSGETFVPVVTLQPENEAETFQIRAAAEELKRCGILNYDNADAPWRNVQITLPLFKE